MRGAMPIVLFAVAGLLLGGVLSLRSQGRSKPTLIVLGVLAAIAFLGGVAWMLPKGVL